VNHTRFPKEDRLPDWARRDNKVTKGDRVESGGKLNILGGDNICQCERKVDTDMCLILNGQRDTAVRIYKYVNVVNGNK